MWKGLPSRGEQTRLADPEKGEERTTERNGAQNAQVVKTSV